MANANYVPKLTWTKVASANDTSTSFTTLAVTTTTPSTNLLSNHTGSTLELMPYGAGADNSTFDLRVVGWSIVGTLYIPRVICRLSCTECGMVGSGSLAIASTDRFVDIITVAEGTVLTPAAALETPHTAIMDISGDALVTVEFDMTGATNGNALWRTY